MSLVDDFKKRYSSQEFTAIKCPLLDITIHVKPLTLSQASEIDSAEGGTYGRIATIFMVRAKHEDGKPIVKPDERSDFMRYADEGAILEAVGLINKTNLSVEEIEKKS